MIPTSQIHTLIDDFVLSQQEKEPRPWLGASQIGEKCVRQLWYSFRWCGESKHDARMLRLFNRGHREEIEVAKLLRGAGFQVALSCEVPEDHTQDEWEAYFKFKDIGGHFKGTLDGILRHKGMPDANLEIKTWKVETVQHPNNGFNRLCRVGVKEASYKHWSQMQTYMGETKRDHTLYVAVCKNDDRLYLERVTFDPQAFNQNLLKAEKIINSTVPPERISENPDTFTCRYCHFKSICHESKLLPVSSHHCRNCRFASPIAGGKWECQKGHPFGNVCPDYHFVGQGG